MLSSPAPMASPRPTRPPTSHTQPRPRSLFTPQTLHTLTTSLPRTSTLRQAASRPTGVNENLARRSTRARSTSPPLPPLPPLPARAVLEEEEEGEADPPPAYTPRPHHSEASVSFGPLRPWGRPFLPFPAATSASSVPELDLDLDPPPPLPAAAQGQRSSSLTAALADLRPPPPIIARHQQTASDPLLPTRSLDTPPAPPPPPHDAEYDSDGSFHSAPSPSQTYRSPFLPPPSPLSQHPDTPQEPEPDAKPDPDLGGSTSSASSWAPARGLGLGTGLAGGWASSPSLLSSLSPTPTGPTHAQGLSHSAGARPGARPPRAQRPEVRVPPAPAWLDEALYTASPTRGDPPSPQAQAHANTGSHSHGGRESASAGTSPRFTLPPGAAAPSPMTASPLTAFDVGAGWGSGSGAREGGGEGSPAAAGWEGMGWESEGARGGRRERTTSGREQEQEHTTSGVEPRLRTPSGREREQAPRARERTVSSRERELGLEVRGSRSDERWLAWERLLAATREASGSGAAEVGAGERERRAVFEHPRFADRGMPGERDRERADRDRERERERGREREWTDPHAPSALPVVGRPLMHQGSVLCYPEGYRCSKCSNTGYKAYDPTHPCRKCWQKYGRPFVPPLSLAPRGPSFQRPLPAPAQQKGKRLAGGSLMGAWPESGERGRFAGATGGGFVFPKAAPPKTLAQGAGVVFPVPAPTTSTSTSTSAATASAPREREQRRLTLTLSLAFDRDRAEREERERAGKCAGCDGSGAISVLFFDDQVCPTCRGTGMLFLEEGGQ